MADTGVLGLVTGQIIGRWGNFFNCEAFGGYTDSLLAMRIRRSLVNDNMLNADVLSHKIVENGVEFIQVHPTFLYESCWNLCLLIFMLWFRKYKKYDGQMFWIYLLGYGTGRFWIESLRTGSADPVWNRASGFPGTVSGTHSCGSREPDLARTKEQAGRVTVITCTDSVW